MLHLDSPEDAGDFCFVLAMARPLPVLLYVHPPEGYPRGGAPEMLLASFAQPVQLSHDHMGELAIGWTPAVHLYQLALTVQVGLAEPDSDVFSGCEVRLQLAHVPRALPDTSLEFKTLVLGLLEGYVGAPGWQAAPSIVGLAALVAEVGLRVVARVATPAVNVFARIRDVVRRFGVGRAEVPAGHDVTKWQRGVEGLAAQWHTYAVAIELQHRAAAAAGPECLGAHCRLRRSSVETIVRFLIGSGPDEGVEPGGLAC